MRAAYIHGFLLVCGMGGSPILPEVGLGVGAHALPRADLHSLGSPLCALLVGPTPHSPRSSRCILATSAQLEVGAPGGQILVHSLPGRMGGLWNPRRDSPLPLFLAAISLGAIR